MYVKWSIEEYNNWLNNKMPPTTVNSLNISNSNITDITPLKYLKNLSMLDISNNNIFSLDNISHCVNLKYLCVGNNFISDLKPISNFKELSVLSFTRNNVTDLSPIADLIELKYLDCSNNYIVCHDIIDSNLKNLSVIITDEMPTKKQSLYEDKENLHDHHIQKCVISSIENIMKVELKFKDVEQMCSNNTILTKEVKELIVKYNADTTIHSLFKLTFKTLFTHVYNRILSNPHSNEIFEILNAEILDSKDKCFSGKICRLLNALNGFDDLVILTISENTAINEIIINIGKQIKDYTPEQHRKMATIELMKRDYSSETIDSYIQFIE